MRATMSTRLHPAGGRSTWRRFCKNLALMIQMRVLAFHNFLCQDVSGFYQCSDRKESWFRYVIYMLCPRKCLSMVTPRLHTAGLGRMVDSMMLTSGILWWMENREVKWAISVLSGLHARPLEVHQMRMSLTHSSSLNKAAENVLLTN